MKMAFLVRYALPGQDDWRTDQSGIEYHHIVGEQSELNTITEVSFQTECVFLSEFSPVCSPITFIKAFKGQGDGTVPTLSASRVIPEVQNINAPGATRWYWFSFDEQHDPTAEHTGLTQNLRIHDLLLYLLGLGSKPDGFGTDVETGAKNNSQGFKEDFDSLQLAKGPSWNMNALQTSNRRRYNPSYYITAFNTGFISVSDSADNESKILDDTFASTIPGVSYESIGDNSLAITMPTNQGYTLNFKSSGKPVFLEIVKGIGNKTPDIAIRYQDLASPANINVMLKITPNGVEDLRYDADGDGVFESIIAPNVSVSGTAASDITPPTVSINSTLLQGQTTISITATDAGSSVKHVLYSLDGTNYRTYSTPFILNACQYHSIQAFADDNVANRSSIVTYTIPNRPPDVSQAKPSVEIISPAKNKFVSVTIQGVTDPDCDTVSIRIDKIMQDELVNR